jgi:hypothetical protein
MDHEFNQVITHTIRNLAPGMVMDLRYIETELPQPGTHQVRLTALLDSGCGNLHLDYDPDQGPEAVALALLTGLVAYRQACRRQMEAENPLTVPFTWPPTDLHPVNPERARP